MITLKDRYSQSPRAIYTQIGADSAVLLHLDTSRYFSLNETGMAIWNLLGECAALNQVAGGLCEEFDVDLPEAERTVIAFVGDLLAEGLVTADEPGVLPA